MKTPPDETQIVRYLDGMMDAREKAEFEKMLAAHPELAAEMEPLRSVSALVKAHIPAELPVPHADFFNSQIQAEISRDARRPAPDGGILGWLRLRWLVPAAAAALAFAGFLWLRPEHGFDSTTVMSTYAPNPAIHTHVFHSEEANATVLMLDGLAEIPAEKAIHGVAVHHSETDAAVATTTLFSEEGDVLLVLAMDGRNKPAVIVR